MYNTSEIAKGRFYFRKWHTQMNRLYSHCDAAVNRDVCLQSFIEVHIQNESAGVNYMYKVMKASTKPSYVTAQDVAIFKSTLRQSDSIGLTNS